MKRSKGYVRVLTAALLALALLTGPCTQARAGLFDWFTGDDAQETALSFSQSLSWPIFALNS